NLRPQTHVPEAPWTIPELSMNQTRSESASELPPSKSQSINARIASRISGQKLSIKYPTTATPSKYNDSRISRLKPSPPTRRHKKPTRAAAPYKDLPDLASPISSCALLSIRLPTDSGLN